MENISSFTYCDKIQTIDTPNGAVKQIIKPLQELTPVAFPSNYSFAIACVISNIKPNASNHLKITFEDPNGNILESSEINSCTPPKDMNPDPNKTYSLEIDFELQNTVLKSSGAYATRIIFNERELGYYTISVHSAQEKAVK